MCCGRPGNEAEPLELDANQGATLIEKKITIFKATARERNNHGDEVLSQLRVPVQTVHPLLCEKSEAESQPVERSRRTAHIATEHISRHLPDGSYLRMLTKKKESV